MATTAKVGIDIEVLGYEGARSKMADLEAMMKGLNGRKNKIKLEADIKRLEKDLLGKKAHKIKIQAEMSDVNNKLRRTRQAIKRLQEAKLRFQGDPAMLGKIDAAIARLRSRLTNLNSQKINIQGNLDSINGQINAATSSLQRMKAALKSFQGMSLGQIFNATSSRLAHVGQAMKSAGNAITRMGAPIRNMMRYMGIGAGFTAFNKISEGLSSGFSRYDTMKKYPKIMAAFGYSADQAQKSIDALDKSVRGLPTGLDEMVDMSQRFTATTGDIEKGTKLAIAANNAFLASMSTDTQRYQGMMQLQDVLGGKDMKAMEWNSLVSSMTPAIVKMGESLGYTKKNMDEWIQKVRDGKVENEDFIDTLIKVGNEGGAVAKMAQESKDTWQAFAANVGNAFSRMSAGIIKSMDEVVSALNITDADGNKIDSVNLLLSDKLIPTIDNLTDSAKKWIQANPEKIIGFFDTLKGIDWKGLGQGFAEGMMAMAKSIKSLAGLASGGSLKWVGRILPYLMPIGSALTIMGGLWKGGRHIVAGIVTGLVGLGRLLTGVGGIFGAGAIAGLGNKIQKGIEALKNFGKLKAATDTAEAAAKGAAKNSIGLKASLKTMTKGFAGIAMGAAAPVIISGGIMLTVRAIKDIVKNLGTITADMDNINTGNLKKLAGVAGTIGTVIGILGSVAGVLTYAGGLPGLAVGGAAVGGIAAISGIITGLSGLARLFTGNVAASIKNLATASKDIGTISDNLGKLKTAKFPMSGLKNAVKGMVEMGKVLKNKDLPTKAEAQEFKGIYGGMKDAIASIRKSGDEMGKIASMELNIEAAKNKATDLGKGLIEVYDAVKTAIEGTGAKIGYGEQNETMRGKGIVENISGMVSSLAGNIDDLNKIMDTKLNFGRRKGGADGLIQKAQKIGEGMRSLYDGIYQAFATPSNERQVASASNKTGTKQSVQTDGGISKTMLGQVGALDKMITGITGVIDNVRSAYDSLTGDNSLADMDTKAFTESANIAGTLIESIAGVWEQISPKMANFGDISADDMSGQFEGLLSMIQGIKPIITEIASLTEELGGMGGEGGSLLGGGLLGGMDEGAKGRLDLGGIMGILPGMIESLSQISTQIAEMDFETTLPNLDSIKTMLNKINEMATFIQEISPQIAEIDMSGIMSLPIKINTLVTQLNTALNVGVIAQIQESINAFREAINSMIQALNTDFANVEVTINIVGNVTGVDETVSALNAAHDAISAAKDSIKALSGSVHLSIPVSVSLPGVDSAVSRMYAAAARLRAARSALRAAGGAATGGLITNEGAVYRTSGGSVPTRSFPGHPKGTDTVPTWLTPGEYVVKRKATSFWGLDFMRSINHMDIKGVMSSIQSKAMGVARNATTTIINNNTTNNFNTNQNINTNNPNFAFRRSRWVGAI